MKRKMKRCECGCRRPVSIAKRTDTRRGHVKGQPYRFIQGHQPRKIHCPRGHPLSDTPDGRRRCRECHRAHSRTYLAAHLETVRAAKRARYAADPERHRARSRAYRASKANPIIDRVSKHHPRLSQVALGKIAEKHVAKFFEGQGLTVERQKQNAPFDILVTDSTGAKCRVELRYA